MILQFPMELIRTPIFFIFEEVDKAMKTIHLVVLMHNKLVQTFMIVLDTFCYQILTLPYFR